MDNSTKNLSLETSVFACGENVCLFRYEIGAMWCDVWTPLVIDCSYYYTADEAMAAGELARQIAERAINRRRLKSIYQQKSKLHHKPR